MKFFLSPKLRFSYQLFTFCKSLTQEVLHWSCHVEFYRSWRVCVHAKSLQSCLTLCYPMDFCSPGSSVHEILRQEYWSGLPCPPPGDLPDPEIELVSLMSLALAREFFTTSATWEAQIITPSNTVAHILWYNCPYIVSDYYTLQFL